MALTNYTEIKDATLRWMNREGFTNLENDIEDIIGIAQRSIWRTANLNAMQVATTFTAGARIVAAPSDLIRVRSMTLQSDSQSKDIVGDSKRVLFLARDVDTPRYYSVVDTNFYFGPTPDQDYTIDLIYYKALADISTSNPTNWVSDNHPELILFGALFEGLLFLKDDNRAAVWKAKYDAVLADIELSEGELQHEPGSLAVKDPVRIAAGSRL